MDKPTLLSIPPEMRTVIVSYISRPTDLKSLCLTCQQLVGVATEQLYTNVHLDVGEKTRKPGFFVQDHRGHRHIRSLTAFITDDIGKLLPTRYCPSANVALRLALQLIPRNILNCFSTEIAVHPDTVTTLFTKQNSVRDLALGVVRGGTLELPPNVSEFLPHLERLFIPCQFGVQYEGRSFEPEEKMYGELVRSCHGLKHIALCHASDLTDEAFSLADDLVVEDQARAKFQRLLRPLDTRGAALLLDELQLQNLYLGPPDCDLTMMVNFENLQWLSIHNSVHSDRLLRDLSIAFGSAVPKLRGLKWYDDIEDQRTTFNYLQQLLRSFSGLEYLSIVSDKYDGEDVFDGGCLNTHLTSLRHLRLSMGPGGPYIRDQVSDIWSLSLTELQALVEKAPNLGQLALSLSQPTVRDLENGNLEDYNGKIDAIATLPRLEILHVLTRPVAQTAENIKHPAWDYLREPDSLANHFVRRFAAVQSRNMKLKAICFGRPSDYGPTEDIPVEGGSTRRDYARAFYVIKRSGNAPSAVRVEPLSMRYEEPLLNMISRTVGRDAVLSVGGFGSMHSLRYTV